MINDIHDYQYSDSPLASLSNYTIKNVKMNPDIDPN